MYKFIKRLFDIIFAIALLPLIIPFSIFISFIIIKNSKGPILFKQKRIGLNYKTFIIYKFRTMYLNPKRNEKQTLLGDPNIIEGGNFLRRFKLDELPQILNILKGDMSFVGPRPCLESTLQGMPQWAKKRFNLKPGLSGLSQVNGNIKLTWSERWAIDIKYVNNLSFLLDLKIILKTFIVIFFGEKITGKFQ
tara:strand:- start:446 stop:1021 length:576 start_codon:yes stop_codon:yes gene_type:complete